jgi:Trypsin-co-occurring domain 1
MERLSTFKLPSGDIVMIESSEPPENLDGEQKAGLTSLNLSATEKTSEVPVADFATRLKPLIETAKTIRDSITSMIHSPTEVTVVIGLKVVGESGIVISKLGGEASISATLKWSIEKDAKPKDDKSPEGK